VPETTAVIFDLDDTLYAERRFALSGYAAVATTLAGETGMPASVLYRFMVRRFRRLGREGLLQALCAAYAIPTADIPRLVEVIRSHEPRLTLPSASRAVLRELRESGHRLGVLTNGLPSTQRAKIAALDIAPLVDAVVYAQEHAPDGKPAPVCFAAALRRLDAVATQTVFVGDHPDKDIAGAADAGMQSIWMARRRPAALGARAGAIAQTLAEVPDLVARLLEVRHVAPC
jgi:putative hydrolase of the HAD superfamily